MGTHKSVWLSLLWSHAPFSWDLVCTMFCLCFARVPVSPVLWKICNQIPLAFKVKFPRGSQSLCLVPRLGNLLWALELSQQCENFSGIIVLQFVGCLLGHSKVGLMSSKRTQATHHTSQVCGSQSPRPCGRPLLTCASTGDTQRQVWLSLLWGPWVLVHRRVC